MVRSVQECYAGTYLVTQEDGWKPENFVLADVRPKPHEEIPVGGSFHSLDT